MRKLTICLMVILVAALFVPSAKANPPVSCYVLTNFCDGLQISQIKVGGIQKTEAVGLWDWVCLKVGTGTLISGSPGRFGTQPLYPYAGGTGSGFNANFAFNPLLGFDLYGTFDGATTFAFQTNQPFTRVKGPCNPLAPKTGRSTTGR